jgi:hypothetical protein
MPLSSGFKSKPLLDACLHDLLFDPEEEGSTFLRNVDEHLPDYTRSIAEDNTLHKHVVRTEILPSHALIT